MNCKQRNRRQRGVIIAALLSLFLYPSLAWAQTLHAVVAVDSNDRSIGESVMKDLESMSDLAREISQNTGMRLSLTQIHGQQLNQNRLLSAVRAIRAGQNDMILFYYSGHGFRRSSTPTNWPMLAIPGSGGVDYSQILTELTAKNARFTMAMADACNSYIDRGAAPAMNFRAFNEPNPQNYRKLFLEARGRLFATSSKPGQYSYALTEGGAFTVEFLKALRSEINGQQAASWERIMRAAGRRIGGGSSFQDPIYELAVGAAPAPVADNDNRPNPNRPTPPRPPTPTQDDMPDVSVVTDVDEDSDDTVEETEVGGSEYCRDLAGFVGQLQQIESAMPQRVDLRRDRARRDQLRRIGQQLANIGGDEEFSTIVENFSVGVKLNNWNQVKSSFRQLREYMQRHQRQECS